jgi:hypothetical protein
MALHRLLFEDVGAVLRLNAWNAQLGRALVEDAIGLLAHIAVGHIDHERLVVHLIAVAHRPPRI